MDADFLKLVEGGEARRPVAYNRRWHLDEDDRRHQGRRKWEPAAIEALVRLAATVESLYPPDWSHEKAVRFRAKGKAQPLAEVFTDSAEHLRVVVGGSEITVTEAEQVMDETFAARFTSALER